MAINRLPASKVERANKPGRYADGGGLWLQVSKWKTKSWLFQFTSPTKIDPETGRGCVRQMGLGALHTVKLEAARKKATECRELIDAGIDPIEARHQRRMQQRLEAAKTITFKMAAAEFLADHKASWRNEKHREQWAATLATYAYPVIGDLAVANIDVTHVQRVLKPIWHTKPETAGRLRGRIERVLGWARVHGYRAGDNPARWKDHLDKLLPSPRKLKSVRHHPALPYAEVPTFMDELRSREGISARALEITILTALRTSEVIGASRDEIDFAEKTWTIPGARMKTGKEHRVPLCDRAIEIIEALPREDKSPHVFIGGKKGAPLSNMAMLELMREVRPGLTVHGFRSTFRDWAAESTSYPNHVVEMALAHAIGNDVEKAYRRGDLFNKRRRLMTDWARYCSQKPIAKADNVTPLRRAGSKR